MITVEIADTFNEAVERIDEFLLRQDPASSLQRSEELDMEIAALVARLKQFPKIGRPADFYAVSSSAELAWLQRIERLAKSAGLTEFRERTVAPYLVLYVCSEDRVVLLSIRHEREASYGQDDD